MEDAKGKSKGVSIGEIVESMLLEGGAGEVDRRYIDSQIMFVEDIFPKIMEHIRNGEKVRVMNFGTFSQRLARESVYSPNSGSDLNVKNRIRLGFTPSRNSVKTLNED